MTPAPISSHTASSIFFSSSSIETITKPFLFFSQTFSPPMDPISDLPPVAAVPELNSENPPTPLPLSSNGAHPPYSDMIIAAISALKDKDGSSRQAIAKYIEKEYVNLPPTHSNLLTHHLKRMKNEGQLMMVKHSYMLPVPRSVPFQPSTQNMDHQYSGTVTDTAGFKADNASVLPRRKPGRPPKPRHDFGLQPTEIHHPYQPQFEHHLGDGQDFQSQPHMGASGEDLQSHYGSGQEFQGNYARDTEPIFVSLGLADVPALPPPENAVVSPKRGRGRPPKVGGVSSSVVTNSGGGGGDVETGKRGRRRKAGRPKLMSISMVNGGGVKRSIGRPKRIGGPVTVPLSGNVLRPRGRPRRAVSRPIGRPANNVSVHGGDSEGGSSRRRGRPPKSANKARKLTSQSYGLPSKVGPGTAVLVTDPHQLVAYQELKLKYERLQSKAKEVLSVVRPYVNSDYAAFGALQELETLVTDGNPPSRVQSENPPSFV